MSARARLAEGESYLQDAEKTTNSSAAQGLREKGQRLFEAIVSEAAADDKSLAGAYTGLGDCLFFAGAAADDKAKLKDAAKHYLRVVVSFEEQSQYVPKALYYAFRCFTLMGERARRADMRRELLSLYPDSEWAKKSDVN